MPIAQLRVMIVDDQEIARVGIRSALEQTKDMSVIGEAERAVEGVAKALRLRPDVVVMELRFADGSGVDACHRIRSGAPGTKVLFLSAHLNPDAFYSTLIGRGEWLHPEELGLGHPAAGGGYGCGRR